MTSKMPINKHWVAFALAASMASVGSVAYAADAVDNQNSVNAPGKPNSGPGVQGFPDTRTGPATRAPGDDTAAPDQNGSSSSATTQPSQDSSGVEGLPGNKSGRSSAEAIGKHDKKNPTQ
jgi:hypothetical protein